MEYDKRLKAQVQSPKSKKSKADIIEQDEHAMMGNSWMIKMLNNQSTEDAEESIASLFGETTGQMAEAEHLTIRETGRFSSADSMPANVKQQLLNGFRFEGWDVSTAQEALDMIDSDGVAIKEIKVNGTSQCFTHLEFYMGDTEVGYIYRAGTLQRVAVVSDQDIHSSETLEPNRLAISSPMDSADRVHMNRKPKI